MRLYFRCDLCGYHQEVPRNTDLYTVVRCPFCFGGLMFSDAISEGDREILRQDWKAGLIGKEDEEVKTLEEDLEMGEEGALLELNEIMGKEEDE